VHRVSLRIVTMPIQSQGIITKDNVSIDVSAVAYYRLREILDVQTEEWGIEVTVVELRDIQLPESMQRVVSDCCTRQFRRRCARRPQRSVHRSWTSVPRASRRTSWRA
jgi:regulator of protease activity HflC (stomatin/prohibitin superfamily)